MADVQGKYIKESQAISLKFQVKIFGIIERFNEEIKAKFIELFNNIETFIFSNEIIRQIAKQGGSEFDNTSRLSLESELVAYLAGNKFKTDFNRIFDGAERKISMMKDSAYQWVIDNRVKLFNQFTPKAMTIKFMQSKDEKKALNSLTNGNNLGIKENLDLIKENYQPKIKSRIMTEINKASSVLIARETVGKSLSVYRDELIRKVVLQMQDFLFRAYHLAGVHVCIVNRRVK